VLTPADILAIGPDQQAFGGAFRGALACQAIR